MNEVRLVAVTARERHLCPVDLDGAVRLRKRALETLHATEVLGGDADLGLEAFDEPLGTESNRVGDRTHSGHIGPSPKAREREAHCWMRVARPPLGQKRALHHVECGVGRRGFEQGVAQARDVAPAPEGI